MKVKEIIASGGNFLLVDTNGNTYVMQKVFDEGAESLAWVEIKVEKPTKK